MEFAETVRGALEPLVRKRGVARVAEAIGWQQSNLSAWLAGRRDIPAERVDDLCAALGVELRVRVVRRR